MANPKLNLLCHSGDAVQCANPIVGSSTLSSALTTFGTGYYANSKGALYVPDTTPIASDSWTVGFDNSEDGCIEGWFKTDGWTLLNTSASDGENRRFFTESTGGEIYIYFNNGTGLQVGVRQQYLTVTSISISANTWYHFACSWSKTLNLIHCYLDGVLIGTATKTLTPTLSNFNLEVGSQSNIVGKGWKGWIDGVRFWNTFKTDFKDRNKKRAGMNDRSE